MTKNLVSNITELSNLEPLNQVISGLIGETCWRVNLSYGDELILHFGKRIPYSQKSMIGKEKGAWILGTQATQWQIDCDFCYLSIIEKLDACLCTLKIKHCANSGAVLYD